MSQYTAPLRDIQFVLHDLLNVSEQYASLKNHSGVDQSLVDSILQEAARFAEQKVSPLNRTGDEEGCHCEDGVVTTPKGFKDVYKSFAQLGLGSIAAPQAFGGQGLPHSLDIATAEMTATANWSLSMYSGVSQGAVKTIMAHGTEQQKQTYLHKLVSGEWTGTMCLSEPQAGSDLGLIRTKAEPLADGSYSISGTKIFISVGEHDLADNIIHIVLARLPDAPPGTKGISLFIVPKINVSADSTLGTRNHVNCSAIEQKMGLKASSTCTLNFEEANGFLIGAENKGLNCMFTFMNSARIHTALQGVCTSEAALQGSLSYAKERLAMRSLSGAKYPDKEADPIIVHPAVKNMLLTQKCFAEGSRALVYWLATQLDQFHCADSAEERKKADDLMSFMTPIAKAFLTEMGLESAKHGIQIYGGHGYIRENGMEQIARDARISTLYEGTTEIQSLDLIGRKVLGTEGRLLHNFTKIIHTFCQENKDNTVVHEMLKKLTTLNKEWTRLSMKVGVRGMILPEEVSSDSVDFMYFSGYVTLAYLWARMALTAAEKRERGHTDSTFLETKIKTAQFYFEKILPRANMHLEVIEAGGDVVRTMNESDFVS